MQQFESRGAWCAPRFLRYAVLLSLLLPGIAAAQVAPYTISFRDHIYTPLENATDTLTSGDDVGGTISLPFEVEFFGERYTEVGYSSNGYLVFTTHTRTDWSNDSMPSATDPDGIVAVWWEDSRCDAGGLTYEIQGTEPARKFIFQWDCYGLSTATNGWQAQAVLYEGSSTIEVRYGVNLVGTRTWTVTVGIEDQTGSLAYIPFPCSAAGNCTPSVWPTNQAIIYSQGPDLEVTSVATAPVGWAGVPHPLEATARNGGGKEAIGAQVRFWISEDATLDPLEDYEIGVSPDVHDLQPFTTAVFTLEAPLPEELTPGTWYILAEADPFETIDEGVEGNNVYAHYPFVIGEPMPDLAVTRSTIPGTVMPGEKIVVDWAVRNIGNEPATNVPFGVYLSVNDSVSSADYPLHTGLVNVGAQREEPQLTEVTIPADLMAGTYWAAVIVDPNQAFEEIDEFNNIGAAHPVVIRSDDLEVLTTFLPGGEINSEWCHRLRARGGDGVYTWSLEEGTLPSGVHLEEELANGEPVMTSLCGNPDRIGTYSFTLRVESADLTAFADYEVQVVEPGIALTVATYGLPDGTVLEPYNQQLAAVGGRIPYQWSLRRGELPEGIVLDSSGTLQGTPLFDGVYTFVAQVRDASDQTKEVELDLVIGPALSLRCLSRSLPSMTLGDEIDVQLRASGGTEPYTWKTLEAQRLGSAEDKGETHVGNAPPNLTLSRDGRVSGRAAKAGSYLWVVEVVGAEGGIGDRCSILFDVSYESGITITTTRLAAAYVGSPYEVDFSVAGGTAPWAWTVQSNSELPEGLELTQDGTLRGVLDEELLQGKDERQFSFGIVVHDAENREDTASFTLTLLREKEVWVDPGVAKPRERSRCQAAGGGAGLLALVAVLGLVARRRRS